MARDETNLQPNDETGLQEKADAIASLMFKFCVPSDYTDNQRRLYFMNLAINYTSLVSGYARQRDDTPLKRVSSNEIQGILPDRDDVNPDTHAMIVERMDEPFYHYMVPITDVRVAYFDYIVEKQIGYMMECECEMFDSLQRIDEGDDLVTDRDALSDAIIRNKVYCDQLDDFSYGLVGAVNMTTPHARAMASPYQTAMADMALKMVDFAEACVPFRLEGKEITKMLIDKPMLLHKVGLTLDRDNRLN